MKFSLATAIFKLLVSVPWCRADGMLLPSTGKEKICYRALGYNLHSVEIHFVCQWLLSACLFDCEVLNNFLAIGHG